MIDTIGVRFIVWLPVAFYSSWATKKRGGLTYEQWFTLPIGMAFHATYHPIPWGNSPGPILEIRFSVPKLLHGCNHTMMAWADFPKALDIADRLIHSIPEFENLPSVREALLVRFDPCYNWLVGDYMRHYLRALQMGEYRRLKKQIHKTGVLFTSSITSIDGYDKGALCKHAAANGMFRFEVQVHNARYIAKLLRKEHPTVLDLTPAVVYAVLEKTLHRLHLSDRGMCDETEATARIRTHFAGRKALSRNLIHYCQDRNQLTPETLKERYSRPTIRKYEKLLGEAGVSSVFLDEKRTVAPLQIGRPEGAQYPNDGACEQSELLEAECSSILLEEAAK